MNFKNPEFFLFLPVLLFLFFMKFRQRPPAVMYSMTGLIKKSMPSWKLWKIVIPSVRLLALSVLIVAWARPVKGLKERSIKKPALDIMMVMDVSNSMNAIDFNPFSRMTAAKNAAMEFVSKRSSDRVGVIVFSGLPIIQCPLTLDSKAVIKLVDIVEAGMVKVSGTAIGMGISLGLNYLDESGSPSKILILVTDGSNNAGEIKPLDAAQLAASMGIKIYTIGAGLAGPAKIPVDDPVQGKTIVTIPDELDEDLLKEIAELTDGKYFRATSFESFKEIYSEIDLMEKRIIDVYEHYEYEEMFRIFLYIGGILLLIELILRMFFVRLFI